MYGRQRAGRFVFQQFQFFFEDLAATRIFIAQVDPDLAYARAPRRDQHAFQKAMRVALEIPAVLEGARLALVDVHRHHARLGLRCDEAPLASGRKARAAEPAQRGVLHDLGHCIARALAREASADQFVAALLPVLGVADVRRDRAGELALLHRLANLLGGRIADRVLPDVHARRDLAAPDARRGNDADAGAEVHLEELLRTGELARNRLAHPHAER